jgi:electron transfer flavoprotein alpha subunit
MANILVYAESRGGDFRKVAFEAVTAGRALADKVGGEVHAIVCGPSGIAGKADQLAKYGADVVVVAENAGFTNHAREAIAATVAPSSWDSPRRAATSVRAWPRSSMRRSSPMSSRSTARRTSSR